MKIKEKLVQTFLDPYKKGLPESVENELANRYKELFEIFINNKDRITWLVNDVPYKTFTPNDSQGQPYPFNDEFY